MCTFDHSLCFRWLSFSLSGGIFYLLPALGFASLFHLLSLSLPNLLPTPKHLSQRSSSSLRRSIGNIGAITILVFWVSQRGPFSCLEVGGSVPLGSQHAVRPPSPPSLSLRDPDQRCVEWAGSRGEVWGQVDVGHSGTTAPSGPLSRALWASPPQQLSPPLRFAQGRSLRICQDAAEGPRWQPAEHTIRLRPELVIQGNPFCFLADAPGPEDGAPGQAPSDCQLSANFPCGLLCSVQKRKVLNRCSLKPVITVRF